MRKKQTSGRKENESEALRESECRLRLIMENTSDGINISEYDPQTDKRRLVICNDRYVEMSGRSREELMAVEDINQFVAWDTSRGQPFSKEILKSLPLKGEASWLRPDGKENFYEWTASPLKADSKYHIIGIDRDITERKQAEEKLRRLATIAEQAAEGIAVANLDGVLQFVNAAWAKMHGYETGSELVGRNLTMFHTPEQMKTDVIPFNEKVKCEDHNAGEVGHIRKDGTAFPMEMSVNLLKDEEGNPIGLDAFAIDITDRRQAEEALHASELQYRTTLDSMGDAIHVVDKDLRIVLCNSALEQWCRQLGLESKLVGKTVFEAFPFLTEEVRDELHHVFQTGEAFVREETNTIGNKEYNVEARKIPILDKGKVVQIVTVIRDVTKHKRAEEALRDSEETARALLDATQDLALMIDTNGTLLAVNDIAAAKAFKKAPSEIIGKNVRDTDRSGLVEHRLGQSDKVVRTGKPLRFEDEHDGKWLDHSVYPIFDGGGKVVRIAIFATDITDRKQAEKTLRKSEYDLRMRVRELNCLYNVTEVVNRCDDSLDDLLQGIVNALPETCQHPESACARITVSGKKYQTDNFRKSQTKLAADILVAGEKVGVVEIFCLKEKPAADEGPFLEEERSLIDTVAARIGRNIERIQNRRQLLAEQSALHEKNIALREVMSGVQDEKKEFGRRISRNVEKIVMPLLHALEQELPPGQSKYMDLLKGSLEEITLPFADKLSKEFATLTPAEIRICHMIRRGLSTKQIAGLQHVSPATVNKHRERIRRKLQITNKDVNLVTYLETYMSEYETQIK